MKNIITIKPFLVHIKHFFIPFQAEMLMSGLPDMIACGKNDILLRYCYEEELRTGIIFPKSDYYIALTRQQHDDFDDWRDDHSSRTRRRYNYIYFDLALKTWLKERSEDQWRDVAACVEEDDWVKLTQREVRSYYDWREARWSRFENESQ